MFYGDFMYCMTMTKPRKTYHCPWCKRDLTIDDMRGPGGGTGRPPFTCHSCREENPGLSYCEYHNQPHPVKHFYARPGHLPAKNCSRAEGAIAQIKSGDTITCRECKGEKARAEFRGRGTAVKFVCRECEEAKPGEHLCYECNRWLPKERFTYKSKQSSRNARCQQCVVASMHGMTISKIVSRQGSSRMECAACGSTESLHIDHDHSHCAGRVGCPECVRAYLCYRCNTAEGYLSTVERAELLVAYMRRHAKG